MSVNLIICSYSGKYPRKFETHENKDKYNFLKHNLYLLNQIKTNISQITIMRPKINENHEPIPNYYNIDNLDLDNIRHKIKFCDCENVGISYGQFIKGIELNNTFDYHIFTEDDYLPFKDYFEDDLITELNNIEKDSFLCLYIKKNVLWNIKDYLSSENSNLLENKFSKFNISINSCIVPDFSLGILSKYTIEKLNKTYINLDNVYDIFKVETEFLWHHQVLFGNILNSANVNVHDLKDKYLNLFYETTSDVVVFYNFEKLNKETPLFIPLDILYPCNNSTIFDRIKNTMTEENYNKFLNLFIKLDNTKKKYNIYYE
jgi:hypothetical protein